MVRASWIGISSYDFALAWGWYAYDGDISYGRLTRIPYQEIQWYHAVAPAILLLLTRICLLYTSPSPRDGLLSRMPSSA